MSPPPVEHTKLPFQDISGHTFRHGRYQLLNILGNGAFGITYRAIDRSITSRMVYRAVKVQLRPEHGSLNEYYLRNEVRLMMNAGGHENVVKFYDFVEDETYSYIVMDLCSGCSLQTCIEAGYFRNNEALFKHVYIQLLEGVRHLHLLGIYHYDLKPDNILVSPDWRVKIIDFGLASSDVASWVRGTRSYRPPETFLEGNRMIGPASDIWALGIILVMMIANIPLWNDAAFEDPHFRHYIMRRNAGIADFSELPVTPEIGLLLHRIFSPDYWDRPFVGEIMEVFMNTPHVLEDVAAQFIDFIVACELGIACEYQTCQDSHLFAHDVNDT